jgi:hypothetical protein
MSHLLLDHVTMTHLSLMQHQELVGVWEVPHQAGVGGQQQPAAAAAAAAAAATAAVCDECIV